MPQIKMPDVDISLPREGLKGPEMAIKGDGANIQMPHLSMPSVDVSLLKERSGIRYEIEEGTGGKFKMPHFKMPNIGISLPKGRIEGPDVEMEGSQGGKFINA
ncbi:hypothetical protein KUCAC02_006156 [Chaenocephalus aceratus]|uniref:Uncharacterized protein n=1 Tax=Chaenocephalus aceratus TaxID=36190 RepID=A0ACB9WQQ4_CHAAC|nr:hypothetical protein KUCAC02_006156 [Chaenocephalus aceratus]